MSKLGDDPFRDMLKKKHHEVRQDYRFMGPTSECLCGNGLFVVLAQYDMETRLPTWYVTDGMCVDCYSLVRLPTPVDEVAWSNSAPLPEDLKEQPEIVEVTLDLTCPMCGSDEYTVVTYDAWGSPTYAQCEFATCDGEVEWYPVSDKPTQPPF